MRISGQGSSFFGGGSRKERDRRAAFTRRHRVGERVSGRVLKRERPGYAWVDFEGVELLANIQSDPDPGTLLLFEVIRLEPDIMLQELSVARSQGDPLGPAIDRFWAARTRFESLSAPLRAELAALEASPDKRRAAFLAGLERDPELAAAFAAVSQAATSVSEQLANRGGGRLDYAPWLAPEALSSELLTRAAASTEETAFSFTLPSHGHCEMRLISDPPRRTVRLFLERPELGPAFEDLLRKRLFAGLEVEFFAPAPLPPGARAGLLGPLLGSVLARPRFARRV